MTPTLVDILSERDRRSALRAERLHALSAGGKPCVLVQLSPVAPSGLRDKPEIDAIFVQGARHFESAADAMGWNPVRIDSAVTSLGPWRLWALHSSAASPARVKYLCVGLEEHLPAGRLLDFDVETRDGPIGREAFGFAERTCLVCGGSAAVCSGRRVHDDDSVNQAFMRLFESIPE